MPYISSNTNTFMHILKIKNTVNPPPYACHCSNCVISKYNKLHINKKLNKRISIGNIPIFS